MSSKSKELDFNGKNIYAGIDTHLKNWRVTILLDEITQRTFSMDPDATILSNYLKKNYPKGNYFSAYEAGFCGYSVHRALINVGIQNMVVNPADIPTTDKEKKQKEDARDSRKIARSLKNGDLKPIYIPSQATEELRGFVRYRKSVVRDIARNKSRIKSFLYRHGIKIPLELDSASRYWSSNFTAWLKTIRLTTDFGHSVILSTLQTVEQLRMTLLTVNKELRKIAKREPYAHQINLLISIPGVGLIVAMTILSELESMCRFESVDKLCSFFGLVPTTSSSSERERVGSITSRTNKPLREIIIESAWVAVRNDPALALAYSNLCKRMKPSKAIIRIAKKLVCRIRYVLKNQVRYEFATL
jgi:transposase